jgi:hypothetical protein
MCLVILEQRGVANLCVFFLEALVWKNKEKRADNPNPILPAFSGG